MASAQKDRERFESLQAQIRAAQAEHDALRAGLVTKYGAVAYATRAERARLDRLVGRINSRSASLYTLLLRVSPRDWRSGVPVSYVHQALSWDDVITAGALSVVPPPAYGYTDRDARQFAAAL